MGVDLKTPPLTTSCPACRRQSTHLTDWEFSGLNKSVFNYTANYYECDFCGLVHIENITDDQLSKFYADECSYYEKDHFDIECAENIEKYGCYRKVISDSGLIAKPIADVGCGRGGFLQWLKKGSWNAPCVGVDIDLKSIPLASGPDSEKETDTGLRFMEGKATNLPFSDETQSLLTYFHVFEHIRSLDLLLEEAFRVLDDSGHILIEVPDAERYGENPIGPGFWISIREHIYHFTARSLCQALSRHGFEVLGVHRLTLPTPDFVYPSLMLLAKKNPCAAKVDFPESAKISQYVHSSKKELEIQANRIKEISRVHRKVTFWGCSAELFSLLPLLQDRDFALCDSSRTKQKCRYGSIPVEAPTNIEKHGALIVAPYLHKRDIERAAIESGWSEAAIFHLDG
jgi:SAM-dependent methyltransferase